MGRTVGYHVVKSAYGLWLPGDDRGHWSSAWDDKIGYCQPHMLHRGDPARQRMAAERMLHPAIQFSSRIIGAVAAALADCVEQSNGDLAIAEASVVPTHMHLLIPYSGRDIDATVKWIADRTTKAVHSRADHAGPLWCKGRWRAFVFDAEHWEHAKLYIRQHNAERGLPGRPYAFLYSDGRSSV